MKRKGEIDSSNYGKNRKHPLYEKWRWTAKVGRTLEWNTFKGFLATVTTPPDTTFMLYKTIKDQPYGPLNYQWKAPLDLGVSADNPDYYRKWRKKHKDKTKSYTLSNGHNITLDEFNAMKTAQNNRCAICNNQETTVIRGTLCDLAIDHCHKTMKTRGLLCAACNRGLGFFRDNSESLRKAADYIDANS